MARNLSCAVLLLNEHAQLLLCHVTGRRWWDVPKGLQEPGETPRETALRELVEETGLVLQAHELLDLGRFDYRPDKDLHFFAALRGSDAQAHTHHRQVGEQIERVQTGCGSDRDFPGFAVGEENRPCRRSRRCGGQEQGTGEQCAQNLVHNHRLRLHSSSSWTRTGPGRCPGVDEIQEPYKQTRCRRIPAADVAREVDAERRGT